MAFPTLGVMSATGYPNNFIATYDGDKNAQGRLIVGWTLNEEAFALNAYTTVIGSDKPIFYYRKYKSEDFVRVVHADGYPERWADGADVPRSIEGPRSTNILVELERFGEMDFIGHMSEDFSDIGSEIPIRQAFFASRGMIRRALKVQGQLTDSTNYPSTGTTHYYTKWGIFANDSTIIGSGQSYPTGYFGVAGTNTGYDGTFDDTFFKKMLNHGMNLIQRRSNSQLQPKDLCLVLNPNTAARLAATREVRAFIAQQQGSLDVIKGKNPTYNGMMYGLPDPFHGLKVVVDGTTRVSVKTSHTTDEAGSYLFPDNMVAVLARPGTVRGLPGTRPYSSILIWQDKKRAMKPQTFPDPENERTKVKFQDMFAARLIGGEIAFVIKDISDPATS